MSFLYQVLTQRVDAWRTANDTCEAFPAIRETLELATEAGETGQLRYVRRAQFRVLETCWYLRLALEAPRIPDLCAKRFPKPKDRREAMGFTHPDIVSFIADEGLESCLERASPTTRSSAITHWRCLLVSLTLDDASYIRALAIPGSWRYSDGDTDQVATMRFASSVPGGIGAHTALNFIERPT